MIQPPLGWTTPVTVTKIKDGDTVRINVIRTFDIRIMNDKIYFDTPETFRPKSEKERALGKLATEKLTELLTKEVEQKEIVYEPVNINGVILYNKVTKTVMKRVFRKIVLHIPQKEAGNMADITQLSRFGGLIFADGVEVSQELIDLGLTKHA